MIPFLKARRVLAAVDFGDASASAVALAGEVARDAGGGLTVLHAETLEVPPYFTRAQVEALEAGRREARARAAEYVRTFAAQHTPIAVAPLIVDGPAGDAILRAAPDFDLVVLGTHGRRGARRWWLGSVAEDVVRHAAIPVLVTCARAEASMAEELAHITIRSSDPQALAEALRSCSFPVLFIPDALSASQRSSS